MFDTEIQEKLRGIRGFTGVFPCDKLPKVKRYPSYLVASTDKANGRGEHWVSFLIDRNRIEYSDSFGLPPMQESFINYIRLYKNKTLIWSEKQLQGSDSISCGKFCIAYIRTRSKHQSYARFLSLFSPNTAKNEIIIEEKCPETKHCPKRRKSRKLTRSREKGESRST